MIAKLLPEWIMVSFTKMGKYAGLFHRIQQTDSEIHMEMQRTQTSQNTFEKERSRRTLTLLSPKAYRGTGTETEWCRHQERQTDQ